MLQQSIVPQADNINKYFCLTLNTFVNNCIYVWLYIMPLSVLRANVILFVTWLPIKQGISTTQCHYGCSNFIREKRYQTGVHSAHRVRTVYGSLILSSREYRCENSISKNPVANRMFAPTCTRHMPGKIVSCKMRDEFPRGTAMGQRQRQNYNVNDGNYLWRHNSVVHYATGLFFTGEQLLTHLICLSSLKLTECRF